MHVTVFHQAGVGLGDRHQQVVDGVTTNYILDLAAGLTQVLSDGTNTYLYGNGRIAQQALTTEYFLPDALGSLRQLANPLGAVTLTQSYAPYGETVSSLGGGYSRFQFTGEAVDANGLTYLRARYLDSSTGRFTQRDPSGLEANLYLYAGANPVNRVDPTGLFSRNQIATSFGMNSFMNVVSYYDRNKEHWGFLAALLRALPGDILFAEHVQIMPFSQSYKLGRGYFVGYNVQQGITLNGMTLRTVYRSNNISNPTAGLDKKFWRSTEPTYYSLMDGHSKEEHVDGSLMSDLPDFWSLSVSRSISLFEGEGMYIVDRFGQAYLSLGGYFSAGSPASGTYGEGYIQVPTGKPFSTRTIATSSELRKRISGPNACFGISGSIVVGAGSSICLNQNFISVFSTGVQAGISIFNASVTFPLGSRKENLGWNWALEDQAHGTTKQDVLNMVDVPWCGTYIPLAIR